MDFQFGGTAFRKARGFPADSDSETSSSEEKRLRLSSNSSVFQEVKSHPAFSRVHPTPSEFCKSSEPPVEVRLSWTSILLLCWRLSPRKSRPFSKPGLRNCLSLIEFGRMANAPKISGNLFPRQVPECDYRAAADWVLFVDPEWGISFELDLIEFKLPAPDFDNVPATRRYVVKFQRTSCCNLNLGLIQLDRGLSTKLDISFYLHWKTENLQCRLTEIQEGVFKVADFRTLVFLL